MRKNEILDYENNKFNGINVREQSYKNSEQEQKEVLRGTEEFKYIEFLLKSSISTDANIKSIIEINNQHMKIKFHKYSEGKNTINAWFHYNQVQDPNFLNKIKKNGFEINQNGTEFWTGTINDEQNNEEPYQDTDNIYILCKVVIGRVYCKIVKKNDIIDISTKTIPPDYDSILIWVKDGTHFTSLKCYKYRIFDSEKVIPLYIISFNIKDNISSIRICDDCELNAVAYYCNECNTHLCEECFLGIHNPDNPGLKSALSHHTKVKVEKNKPGYCENCDLKNQYVEFYCEICGISVCSYCKIIGNHSKGISKHHELIDIDEAWRLKNCDNMKDIYEPTYNKAVTYFKDIFYKSGTMKSKYDQGKGEIETQFSIEKSQIEEIVNKVITKEMNLINQLTIFKSNLTWINDYFRFRIEMLTTLKNNRELIWISGLQSRVINEYMANALLISDEIANLGNVNLDCRKYNGFNLIKFSLDENYSLEKGGDIKNRMSLVANKIVLSGVGKDENPKNNILTVSNLQPRISAEQSNIRGIIDLVSKIFSENHNKSKESI